MIYAINYADKKYRKAQRLNTKTAYIYGADKVIEYGEKDIDKSFGEKNRHILEAPRGNGYWLWKPYIVDKTLEKMKDGDYLIYADSGAAYVNKIRYLISNMEEHKTDIMVFQIKSLEKCYTKRDTFILLNCDTKEFSETRQRCGTFFCIKRTENSVSFIREWLRIAQDNRAITDMPNTLGEPNYAGFKDHRHDQSILSILSKKWGIEPFRDASQYGNDMNYAADVLQRSNFPQIFDSHRDREVSASFIIHYLGLDRYWKKIKIKYLGKFIK